MQTTMGVLCENVSAGPEDHGRGRKKLLKFFELGKLPSGRQQLKMKLLSEGNWVDEVVFGGRL